jgi:hypothetical protein
MAEATHDQRSHQRSFPWGTLVFYRHVDEPERDEHLATVADIGPWGLFISMREPPGVGRVLHLKIYSQAAPAGSSTVTARVVVRWRRQWQEPRGAGVELLEDDSLTNEALRSWLGTLSRGVKPVFDPDFYPG